MEKSIAISKYKPEFRGSAVIRLQPRAYVILEDICRKTCKPMAQIASEIIIKAENLIEIVEEE